MTTPRWLLSMIDQKRKDDTEKVILSAVAQRMKDPQELRGLTEKKALVDDSAWDALF